LGLAISQSIVNMMGGEISIDSTLGHGSKFIFTLTLPLGEIQASDEPESTDISIDTDFTNRHILIAEDNEINREIMLAMLEPTHIQIDCAEDGRKAVEMFAESVGVAKADAVPLMATAVGNRTIVNGKVNTDIAVKTATSVGGAAALDDELSAEMLDSTLIFHAADLSDTIGTVPIPAVGSLQTLPIKAGGKASALVGGTDEIAGGEVTSGEASELPEIAASPVYTGDIESKYDVIFMDVQMPIMDGLEATRRIRMLPGGKKVTIIAMTANVFKEDIDRCKDAGMDDHIGKPINYDDLFKKLRVIFNAK
jgi:CheY-like chemotaxis protein